ncbi:Ig domain-containing protein [Leptospira kmetyi]
MKNKILSKLILVFASLGLLYGFHSCTIGREQLVQILIGACTFWPSQLGPKPDYCAFVSQMQPGGRPANCKFCEYGYTFGSCKAAEIGYGSPSGYNSYWEPNSNGRYCGKTITMPNGSTDCSTVNTCSDGNGGIVQNIRSMEYVVSDTTLPLPPTLKSVSPVNGSRIYQSSLIQIQFDKSMQSDTFSFLGNIGNTIANNFQVSRVDLFNDKLSIPGQGNRSVGVGRTLNIKGVDVDGKEITASLIYNVQQDGVAMDPSTTSCQPKCDVNWLNPYSIQFTASGGFPPYQWYMAGDPNLYPPGATLSTDGVLSGPATFNFLGAYPFSVVVVDSTGNTQAFGVSVSSFDALAACTLAGFCF